LKYLEFTIAMVAAVLLLLLLAGFIQQLPKMSSI
jgi:hypothetical protein